MFKKKRSLVLEPLSLQKQEKQEKEQEQEQEHYKYQIQQLVTNIKSKKKHIQTLENFINVSKKEKEKCTIGKGASSIVYKYKEFAVKYCRNNKYFLPELRCLSILPKSNYIISLLAFKIINAYECYLMFPYYPISLETEILEKSDLLRTNRTKWEVQLFRGLWLLHQHNIYHRDIKPANIMINTDNNIVFVDFGIAEFDIKSFIKKGTVSHISNEHKRCNSSQKTPSYIRRCKIWHDMYATAITIYEMYAEQKYKGYLYESFLPDVVKKLPNIVVSILTDVDTGQKLSKRIKHRRSQKNTHLSLKL